MKNILIKMLNMTYIFTSMFILSLTIVYPLVYTMKNTPVWVNPWMIYPLALLICASQKECFQWFDKYQK